MRGLIRSFVPERKFGFIKGDDGKDYFFHQDAFDDKRHKDEICDGLTVEFEPSANPRGYRATNCSLIDERGKTTYIVPDDFPTSRSSTVNGWEIIEKGDWVVHGSSRDSPAAARVDLLDSATRIRANALIDVEYYKTTGAERGTGSGIHHFTIHNFRARVVTVAKRSYDGTYTADDLRGINQRAAIEKERLRELTAKGREKRNVVWVVVAVMALFIATVLAVVSHGFFSVFSVFIVVFIALFVGSVYGQATDYDHWLQWSPTVSSQTYASPRSGT